MHRPVNLNGFDLLRRPPDVQHSPGCLVKTRESCTPPFRQTITSENVDELLKRMISNLWLPVRYDRRPTRERLRRAFASDSIDK